MISSRASSRRLCRRASLTLISALICRSLIFSGCWTPTSRLRVAQRFTTFRCLQCCKPTFRRSKKQKNRAIEVSPRTSGSRSSKRSRFPDRSLWRPELRWDSSRRLVFCVSNPKSHRLPLTRGSIPFGGELRPTMRSTMSPAHVSERWDTTPRGTLNIIVPRNTATARIAPNRSRRREHGRWGISSIVFARRMLSVPSIPPRANREVPRDRHLPSDERGRSETPPAATVLGDFCESRRGRHAHARLVHSPMRRYPHHAQPQRTDGPDSPQDSRRCC